MKDFTARTLEEAVALASNETSIPEDKLIYIVKEEKKGLFKKSATISIYEIGDTVEYGVEYVTNVLNGLGIESVEVKSSVKDGVIKLTLNTDSNPLIIGKNGKTLQALTELVRLACYNKFKIRYKMILEVADYKYKKYRRITFIAKQAAREVLQTKGVAKLDPMTSDERRMVHSALAKMNHIETVSVGEGKERAITIKYVD